MVFSWKYDTEKMYIKAHHGETYQIFTYTELWEKEGEYDYDYSYNDEYNPMNETMREDDYPTEDEEYPESFALFLANENTPPSEVLTTYPMVNLVPFSFEPFQISMFLTVMEYPEQPGEEAMLCQLVGDDYESEVKPRGFKVSDPFGKCPLVYEWDYSTVTYEGDKAKMMSGPGGENYIVYTQEELFSFMLTSEEFVVWIAPEDLSLYEGPITLTLDMAGFM